jgi:L-ascorbate 6-phosphate lactonase
MSCSIKWIGQGGYILNDGKTSLCIDPYLSDLIEKRVGKKRLLPCPVPPQDLEAKLIICTHDHLDHLDEAAISQMNLDGKMFAGPDSCLAHLREISVAEARLIPLNRGAVVDFESYRITAAYANHTEDSIGLVVAWNGIKIYFSGDTLYDEHLDGIAAFSPDIVIICINGKLGNMNVQEAVALTRKINPKVGIPSHYGMFIENTENPALYLEGLKDAGIKGFEMDFNTEYLLEDIIYGM